MLQTEVATALLCPLCQKGDSKVWRTGTREDSGQPVYQCQHCGLRHLSSNGLDLYNYYRTEYRLTHQNDLERVLTPEQNFRLMRPLADMQTWLFKRTVPKGAKVLEIGCSSGWFLDSIRDEYTVYGNEWNPEDAAYVRGVLGIPCSEERLEDAFPGEKFTAICAFQVLEHVANPLKWLQQVRDRLHGGGWVYLEVPNVDDALLSVYGVEEFADRYFRQAHNVYWDMQTLASAIAIVGFQGRVAQRQRYSMYNHWNWVKNHEPQKNALVAQGSPSLADDGHPAAPMLNRFFAMMDRQYRAHLDMLKACDTLVATGVKREI